MPDSKLVRIPLDIIAPGGQKAGGLICAVMVADLDRQEALLAAAEAVVDQIKYPQTGVDNDGYWNALKLYRDLQAGVEKSVSGSVGTGVQ